MGSGRLDWLAELGGASALGLAVGYAALKAAPSLALPGPAAMTAAGFASFGLGMAAMKAVRPAPHEHRLAGFALETGDTAELLLQDRWEEPLLLQEVWEDEALLLEDRLPEASPHSRVVQLFAGGSIPTPGELKSRIDRHLAGAPRCTPCQMSAPQPDAAQALHAALSQLKRSLR